MGNLLEKSKKCYLGVADGESEGVLVDPAKGRPVGEKHSVRQAAKKRCDKGAYEWERRRWGRAWGGERAEESVKD